MDYLQYIYHKVFFLFDVKAISAVFITIAGFLFDPLQLCTLGALFAVIMIDFAFGLAAAKVTGAPITSSKVRRTAVKIVVYFALISAAHLTEATLPDFMHFLNQTVTAFLAVTELISILENAGRMGYAVPLRLLNRLQDYKDGK